jgi:uncharacterized protein (UPF0276 family)
VDHGSGRGQVQAELTMTMRAAEAESWRRTLGEAASAALRTGPGASPGVGIGFRSRYAADLLGAPRAVDWLEVIADTYIGVGGPRRDVLARLRADHPLALHGVGLSIAGQGPLPNAYLRGLRDLAAWVEPLWVGDHLCWTSLGGHQSHDLLPVARTAEVLDHVAERVARAQDLLGRRLLLENATAYVAFRDDEMDEAEFFTELGRRTGCGMLLDVNNLYVNACNLGIDPLRYLEAIPPGLVGYMHLAGHAVLPDVRIDTHDADVPTPVWALFHLAARRFPSAGVVIERDDALPPFDRLVTEVEWARDRHRAAIATPETRTAAPVAAEARPARPAVAPRPWAVLQRELWCRLVDKPLGFDHDADGGLHALLDTSRPVTAARGMRVYSDSYTASLRTALATNFAALARVISDDDFAALAAAYLRRHPPRGHDFRQLGTAFPAFVRSYDFARDYGVPRDVLADLVALEQAQLEVQDGPDPQATVTPAALAEIAPEQWERARFDLVPAMRIVRATADVLPVIEAVERGDSPTRPVPGPVGYLVYRAGSALRTDRIDPREAVVLEALAAGRPFGDACGAAGDTDADEPTLAAAGARALVTAARLGLVTRALVHGR